MTFKDSLRQLVLLLLIGQVFLLGAQWLPVPSGPGPSGPGPSGPPSAAGRTDTPIATATRATPAAARNYAMRPTVRPAPATTESGPKPAPVYLLGLQEEPGQPYDSIHMDFSGPVKMQLQNTSTERFVRFRIEPPLAMIHGDIVRDLKRVFERFSYFRSPQYSEILIFGRGFLGTPSVTTSPTGLPRLTIPFKNERLRPFVLGEGTRLRSGLWYHRDRPVTAKGPTDVSIVRFDPRHRGLYLIPVQANEGICQRERLSSMARRYNAVAGINAAYFNPGLGDPIGTLIINRRLISSPVYNRSVFGVTREGRVLFGNPDFTGTLRAGGNTLPIDGVNQPRGGDKLVVFTSEYAHSTGTSGDGRELIVIQGRVVGIAVRDAKIPPDGVVISAGGKTADKLRTVRLGDQVDLSYQVSPPWDAIEHAVCAGPRLIRDGAVAINGREERFDASIVAGRHPRSAIAETDAGEVLLVVVDGRTARNPGMTLAELALYLRRLGAVQAMNLDGGGSSELMVGNRWVNRPSDGAERPISNAILITTTP